MIKKIFYSLFSIKREKLYDDLKKLFYFRNHDKFYKIFLDYLSKDFKILNIKTDIINVLHYNIYKHNQALEYLLNYDYEKRIIFYPDIEMINKDMFVKDWLKDKNVLDTNVDNEFIKTCEMTYGLIEILKLLNSKRDTIAIFNSKIINDYIINVEKIILKGVNHEETTKRIRKK